MSEEATLDEFVGKDEEQPDLQSTPTGNYASEWPVVRSGEYFSFQNGEFLKSDKRSDDAEYPVYGGNGIMGYTSDANVSEGKIVIGRVGAYCGNIHKTDSEAWVTDNSIILSKDSEDFSNEYLHYLLTSVNLGQFSEQSAQPRISQSTVANLRIPKPPLIEQRKIATVLYTVDRAIEKTKKTISQLKRVKQGLYQTLFSEGCYKHDQFKSSKYGEIPESWDVSRLSEITSQIQAGGTPDTDVPEYYGGDIPWVKTGELSQYRVTKTEQAITERGLEESTARLFSPGTILIAMYGATTGEVSLLDIEAATNQACCGVVTTDEIKPEFLFHQLNYLSTRLESLSAGSGQQNISKGIIEKFDVLVPSVEEQDSIVRVLNSVDKSIDENNATKNQYQNLKRGLMQDLLSGTVRTTDTNIEVPEEIAQYG